jgi:putative N6-adenine-specific DNA methylase
LRTASRVVARAGEFRARGFGELERHVAKLPWREFMQPGTAAVLRVTCRKSKLYHEGAVAERVGRVLADVAGVSVLETDVDDDDVDHATSPGQLVIVRFLRDECTISVDSSGALLHQRGYRQAIAKAPLRETIAGALLLASGWRGDSPLVDPLCGSGTIPIEAALLARHIAPGIANIDFTPRTFAFRQWPGFEPAAWDDVVASARSDVRDECPVIVGSDRDAGAIAAARANAARAGVADNVEFRRTALSSIEPPADSGHVVTNPPYGVRVGERRDLHALYAALGDTMRRQFAGWRVTILAADDALVRTTGLPFVERLATRNGGIPVRLLTTVRPETHAPEHAVYDIPHQEEEVP